MSGEGVAALGRMFVETPEGRRLLPLALATGVSIYAPAAGYSALLWAPAVALLFVVWLFVWLRHRKKSSGGMGLGFALIAIALLAMIAGIAWLFRRKPSTGEATAPPDANEIDTLATRAATESAS